MVKCLSLLFAILLSLQLQAADTPFEFDNPEQEQRYLNLIEELRCLVCQNQSLADSHADLAQDLRKEVYGQVTKGQNNDEIISFLVKRYGDFVLYRPPLKKTTWVLWFGPFLLLLIVVTVVVRLIINNSRKPQETITEQQKEKVKSLLHDNDEGVT